jgi:putative ABC transport system ATP-binding protein
VADLLIADGLTKVYGSGDTATRALSDVSFEVADGEFASIVGQSGSGKSTLLNLLGLLDTPTDGSGRDR